ncbi:MAG: PqqD family protein [Melioribacteraceae bacterium]|nr:PqqD family protein [Melioribacteraceae bacterium]
MHDSDFFDLLPVRNCEYEMEGDKVVLLVPPGKQSFFDRLFFKKLSAKPRKIDLDSVGSFIWGKLAGKITVRELINVVSDKFGMAVNPADERVIRFLKDLAEHKFILLYKKDKSIL